MEMKDSRPSSDLFADHAIECAENAAKVGTGKGAKYWHRRGLIYAQLSTTAALWENGDIQ